MALGTLLRAEPLNGTPTVSCVLTVLAVCVVLSSSHQETHPAPHWVPCGSWPQRLCPGHGAASRVSTGATSITAN